MIFPESQENLAPSNLERGVARRVNSYIHRFNIRTDFKTAQLADSGAGCGGLMQVHLLPFYQKVLQDVNPNLALIRTIQENQVRSNEISRWNSKLLVWETIRQEAVKCIDGALMVADYRDFLESSIIMDPDFLTSRYGSEMHVYLLQLRSGREQIIRMNKNRDELKRDIHESFRSLIRSVTQHSMEMGYPICFESDLREYATCVRRTATKYRECVAEIDGLRGTVCALESEVRELEQSKIQLEDLLGGVDVRAVLERYEQLGKEKVEQMENVTDAVQELTRQLVHKRNILAPKLNELNSLRHIVQCQDVAIREKATEQRFANISLSDDKDDVDQLESQRAQLLTDTREVRFEIEFLKKHMEGELRPKFPHLLPERVSRTVETFERLCELLKSS